jgi:hypothetical protein
VKPPLSYRLCFESRRATSQPPPIGVASWKRSTRLVQLLALLGCAAIALTWAFNEFRGRTGMAGGNDVFVVTTRSDISAQQITSAETIAQGKETSLPSS